MEYLNKDELLKLLAVAKAESQRGYTMLLFGFRFGLRATEICQIKLEDVQGGTFTVQRLKGSKKTSQEIPGHKGLPILSVQRALRDWLAVRPKSSVFLFPSGRRNKALDRTTFFKLFQSYAIQAGLPENKRNPHILKHSFVNMLIRGGADVAYAQAAVGHANIGSTMRYISISDSEAATAAQEALVNVF